ncbi:M48 family metalloprotease [Maribacter sp. SA7]|uniref:M48 family metalloprotease n=1 Tax=Maribacter zhoushanensis TaxID=3030012 RepID=UPI0023ED26A4|nr:M48 family metalloprotease [Maribacter zhoushanensis]MDF4204005.1 M48 family metalloprotease [Maribacter zhoushanensis]
MTSTSKIEIYDFHTKLKDHFKSRKKTWDWFANQKIKTDQKKEVKTSILKNTFRLERTDYENLYTISDEVCSALQIDAQVTFYQEQNSVQLNTSICIIENEAHIVFSGNVLNILNSDEQKALLGHELGHYLFSKMDNEAYEVTERIIDALSADVNSDDAYIETFRKFKLYLELFCDSCAFNVCAEKESMISTLVKLETGLSEVNASSYLKQAMEIISEDEDLITERSTHPESYIRSIALHQKAENLEEKEIVAIKQLVEGSLDLNKLDLFQQHKLKDISLSLIQLILKPKWMQTELTQNLAHEYFANYSKEKSGFSLTEIKDFISEMHVNCKNYLSYILLDFTRADNELELLPLGHTMEISELLDINKDYVKVVKKELKLNQKELKKIQSQILEDYQNIREGDGESLYKE